MLKEKYSIIQFPLNENDRHKILSLYARELDLNEPFSIEAIRIIFANALRDYLSHKITESYLSSLMFDLITNKKIEKVIKKDTKLSKYVSDCLDINWLKQGKYFDEFLLELEEFLKTIS